VGKCDSDWLGHCCGHAINDRHLFTWRVDEGTVELVDVRTAGFRTLALTSISTCFTARSDTSSAFTHLFVNPWLWGAITVSLLLQVAVVNLPFLNQAFGTTPLEIRQWLLCNVLACMVLWFSKGVKLIGRAWPQRDNSY
jgi:P-type Ca2+ transporter type 2C